MNATLKQFLIFGQLGEITMGTPRTEVVNLLGEPEIWSSGQIKSNAITWKYQNIEISFDNDLATLIAIYVTEPAVPVIGIIDYFPNRTTTIVEFQEFLDSEQIHWFRDQQLTFDQQVCLRVGVGVSVLFRGTSMYIDSLQLSQYGVQLMSKLRRAKAKSNRIQQQN